MSYFQKHPREKFPNLGIFGDCQNFERPWLIIRSILNSFIIEKIKIQVICDRFMFKSTIFEIRKILKKFLKLSLFRAKNEKKIQNPDKWHSAFTIFLPEDAIFSCQDFGKPKKSTIAVTKYVRKNWFSQRKNIFIIKI